MILTRMLLLCFNSLQTGKWILTPSNIVRVKEGNKSFNSLQTGKWILTKKIEGIKEEEGPSFNSLQTGKWILTFTQQNQQRVIGLVSIPFKRESGS